MTQKKKTQYKNFPSFLKNNNCLMKTIKKLPQEVIDRIAAGEIIHRPICAIKELIENSIDANSSMISLLCVDGGFSSIEISDDGDGINPADFPLLCERFATSKISDFTDLMKINSFGFRGEALASVSFVSHLSIRSKTKDAVLGYKALFKDGNMLSENAQSVAMNKGTIINVDNLFYNLGVRKNSITFKDEFREVLKFIHKISIHYCNLKFKVYSAVNKLEFSSCNLLSKGKEARFEIISNIFKINEKNLLCVEAKIDSYYVTFEAIFSEVGSVKKNRDLSIFINDRLVECDQIKKTIEAVYKGFWVSIHEDEGGYFCYISLKMRTDYIDVNVDPRKKFVKFLFEKEICNEITKYFEEKLKEKCSIKNFQTIHLSSKTLEFPRAKSIEIKANENKEEFLINKPKVPEKSMVRVDPKTQKLTSFIPILRNNENAEKEMKIEDSFLNFYNNNNPSNKEISDIVFQILNEKKEKAHDETTKFFHNLTYVGCLNSNFILVQKDQKLLIINTIPIWYIIFSIIQ